MTTSTRTEETETYTQEITVTEYTRDEQVRPEFFQGQIIRSTNDYQVQKTTDKAVLVSYGTGKMTNFVSGGKRQMDHKTAWIPKSAFILFKVVENKNIPKPGYEGTVQPGETNYYIFDFPQYVTQRLN